MGMVLLSYNSLNVNEKRFFKMNFFCAESLPAARNQVFGEKIQNF